MLLVLSVCVRVSVCVCWCACVFVCLLSLLHCGAGLQAEQWWGLAGKGMPNVQSHPPEHGKSVSRLAVRTPGGP